MTSLFLSRASHHAVVTEYRSTGVQQPSQRSEFGQRGFTTHQGLAGPFGQGAWAERRFGNRDTNAAVDPASEHLKTSNTWD